MFRSNRRGAALCALAFLVFEVGCGRKWESTLPVFPVSGEVRLDGKPLADAMVVLHPQSVDPRFQTARGTTDAEGKFELSTYNSGDGAAAGDYVLTVEYFEPIKQDGSVVPGPNVLSPEFSLVQKSQIKVQVAAGPGNKIDPIEVTRKAD